MSWTQLTFPALLLLLLLFFSTYQVARTSGVERGEVAAVPVPDYELLDEIFGAPRGRRHGRRKRQAAGSGSNIILTTEGSGSPDCKIN